MEISELNLETQKEFAEHIGAYITSLGNKPESISSAIVRCIYFMYERNIFPGQEIPEMAIMGSAIIAAHMHLSLDGLTPNEVDKLVKDTAFWIYNNFPMGCFIFRVPLYAYQLSMKMAYMEYVPKLLGML